MGLLSIGASLLGGILGRRSQKKAADREAENREQELELQREIAQMQIDAQKVDLQELVSEAQAAGFNPSTVLNATGGQGFGSSQVSAMDLDIGSTYGGPSIASMALTGIGDYFQQNEQRELERAQLDLIKAQTRQINAQTQASPTISAFTTNPEPVHNLSTDQVAAPINYNASYWDNVEGPYPVEKHTFPVRDMSGNLMHIRPSHAKRLDLVPGDTLMVEDYEAIQGEIAGELQGMSEFIPEGLRMFPSWAGNFFGTTSESRSGPRNTGSRGRRQRRTAPVLQ